MPTIGEAGYPDVQGVTFNGVFAPKATPRPVVDKLSAAIRAALAKPEVADRLAALGSTRAAARRRSSQASSRRKPTSGPTS